MSEILTINEAAAYLRVSPHTIRRELKRGRIRALRVGAQWRFRKEDLEKGFLVQPVVRLETPPVQIPLRCGVSRRAREEAERMKAFHREEREGREEKQRSSMA